MTSESVVEQGKFEGHVIVEIFGHQTYAGFMSHGRPEDLGMFRLEVPPLKQRDRTLKRSEYVERSYQPAGTVITEGPVQGYTKFFGGGAIYSMTPCTEEAALQAVEKLQPRPVISITLPPEKAIAAAPSAELEEGYEERYDFDEDGEQDEDEEEVDEITKVTLEEVQPKDTIAVPLIDPSDPPF